MTKENNTLVTDHNNGYQKLTLRQKEFLRKCRKINENGTSFCVMDFAKTMSMGNFRQLIFKLKPFIEKVGHGNPQFYKIKGISIPGDGHRITDETTGVGVQIYGLLKGLKDQPPKVHDIKLQFISNLHEKLVAKDATVNPANNSIIYNFPIFEKNINMKALIYPQKTQISVACTFKPIVYNFVGLLILFECLSRFKERLYEISGATLPDVPHWVVIEYHFGKDGSERFAGQSFNYEFSEFLGGLVRCYSKTIEDGITIVRAEQIRTPKKFLGDVIKETIEHNNRPD